MTPNKKCVSINNLPFYYEELPLIHGRGQMDREIAKENLLLFSSLVEAASIKYGIFFGTLLGAIRENNFIVHDEDSDIYILNEEKNKFIELLFTFRKHDLELVRLENDLLSLRRKNEDIDIYFLKRKRKLGLIKVRVLTNHFEYPAKYIENPTKIPFLDNEIFAPSHPTKILRMMYGKNWKIPIKNHPAPPNTLYKKLSNLTPKLKRLPLYTHLETILKLLLRKLGL